MVHGISTLVQFSTADMKQWLGIEDYLKSGVTVARSMRNFASYVAHEETFQADCPMPLGGTIQQKVLCVTKRRESRLQQSRGSWTTCINQSPGFQRISTTT